MKRVAIIGGGLAGTSCAYVLKQSGLDPVLYEAGGQIAPGASGNARGLYNPRLSAERSPESAFYAAAFFAALSLFGELKDSIDWTPCGALHLMTDDTKSKRFRQCAVHWGWAEDDMRIVTAAEASVIAGVDISHDALYLTRSGFVSPAQLCAYYARGIECHFNAPMTDLATLKADAIIIANGMDARRFMNLPLKAVRGQVTDIAPSPVSHRIKTCLNYGGYMTPAVAGTHMVGSTFQRWLDHSQIIPEDDADNLDKMMRAVPALRGDYTMTGHRAAVRTTTPDHMPIIGRVPGHENIYISTAHGSHGILSSLMGAQILATMIQDAPSPLDEDVLGRLNPNRFSAS